jgi:hypothetical protein
MRDDFTNAELSPLPAMTLQDWGAIGELVGGIAVIATLIYLAMQTRQARRTALAQAPQWISDGFRDWISAPRDNTELAELLIRANHSWGELSPVEQFKAHCWWGDKVVHLDAILTLHEQGIIDDSRKEAWVDDCLGMINTPGGLEWWSNTMFLFTPQLQGELESRIRDPSSLPDGWTTTLPFFRIEEPDGESKPSGK